MKKIMLASALLLGPTLANAGLISFTNNTVGVVDNSSQTQSVTVTNADLVGFIDNIIDVNLTVDFSKCGGSANSAGCTGNGFTFNREIVFDLEHLGAEVAIVGQDTFSGQSSNGRVTQTYDDEALLAVGGALLQTGAFQPVESLSAFDAMSALGVWEFTFTDTVGSDPLVVHSWTLDIELREDGDGSIPAPTTLALFGLGLAGLGFARRRKV